MNECLCCVSVSLLTVLSDWGLCCRTELGPMSARPLYTYYNSQQSGSQRRLGFMWIKIEVQNMLSVYWGLLLTPALKCTSSSFTATVIESVVTVACFSHCLYLVCRFSEWIREIMTLSLVSPVRLSYTFLNWEKAKFISLCPSPPQSLHLSPPPPSHAFVYSSLPPSNLLQWPEGGLRTAALK